MRGTSTERSRHCTAVAVAALLAATLSPSACPGAVRVEKTHYSIWPDAYRVHNATTEFVVVPTGGRVIRYGPVGRRNLLWENAAAASGALEGAWQNYGGDKIWIWPQDQWPTVLPTGWPPPAAVDQGAYTITPFADGMRLESPVQAEYGVRVVRTLTLAPQGTALTSRTRLELAGTPRATPIAAWEVTQVSDPSIIVVRTRGSFTPASTDPAAWLGIKALPDGWWRLPRPADRDVKEYFHADLVAGATQGYVLYQQLVKPDATTNDEPPLQVYSDRQQDPIRPATVPSYAEFEFLSARHTFHRGQKERAPEVTVRWRYQPLDRDQPTAEELVRQIRTGEQAEPGGAGDPRPAAGTPSRHGAASRK